MPLRELEIRVHTRMSWTYCFLHGNMIGTQLLGPVNPITAVERKISKKKKSQTGVNENITDPLELLELFLCFLQSELYTNYLPYPMWGVSVE